MRLSSDALGLASQLALMKLPVRLHKRSLDLGREATLKHQKRDTNDAPNIWKFGFWPLVWFDSAILEAQPAWPNPKC